MVFCAIKGCDILSTNAIEKIREMEQQAELIEKTAKTDAQNLIENAETEAKQIVEKANAEGRAILEKAVGEATIIAENNSRETKTRSMNEISALESMTEKKLSDAVDMVKDQLIS